MGILAFLVAFLFTATGFALDLDGETVYKVRSTCPGIKLVDENGNCAQDGSGNWLSTKVEFWYNWDRIRMISVQDLAALNWGTSKIALSANMDILLKAPTSIGPSGVARRALQWGASGADCATCDPEVFKWSDGYYYLLYTGAVDNYHGVEFISRSTSLSGPFAKLDNSGQWLRNAPNPKIIVYPTYHGNGEAGFSGTDDSYGTGQATTVVKDGTIYLWVHDYSLKTKIANEPWDRLILRTTTDPATWQSLGTTTNIAGTGSGVVRLNLASGKFRYYFIDPVFGDGPTIVQTSPSMVFVKESSDGITWTPARALFRLPTRSRELGVAENPDGTLPGGKEYISWSAPLDALARPLPDNGTWQPNGLFFAEAPSASVDSASAYNNPLLVPLLGALATSLPEIKSTSQYGYAPALVKDGAGWKVFFCATPYIDRTRRAPIRHEVQ